LDSTWADAVLLARWRASRARMKDEGRGRRKNVEVKAKG
jgi:hypothetical protein